jgi:hypothetical protein
MTNKVKHVHPVVFDIVKLLIPEMLKDLGMKTNYCIDYAKPVDIPESKANEFRVIPDFRVNILHTDSNENIEIVPMFYSMVCPTECKLPGGSERTVVQSIHYLINKIEVTHRDIRPTNIVMYPTKPDPRLHSDFRPILIDWAMAGGTQPLYYPAGLNLDYQPDDIVRLPDKKVSVAYLPKYDLHALQFTVVAIVYNEPIVWWHADKYDRLKVGRDIMVDRVISGEALGNKKK